MSKQMFTLPANYLVVVCTSSLVPTTAPISGTGNGLTHAHALCVKHADKIHN